MKRAFTRVVSPALQNCELTHLKRSPIDPVKAAEQHSGYERALVGAGFEIVRLPELPRHPDGVFVEDTALLLDGHAVITRPGAASRLSETESTAGGLAGAFEMHRLESGFLDGGDVLRIDHVLYVGLSSRTDLEGIASLSRLVAPLGFEVVRAKLRNCLHLKSGATFAGLDTRGTPLLLYSDQSIDPAQFRNVEPFAVDERPAANCVRAGDWLILPAGNPRTAERLRNHGFLVAEVDVSELQKAEAGVTCMSLIDG